MYIIKIWWNRKSNININLFNLLNYLSKKKYFILYLITFTSILNDEYPLPNNIIRISLSNHKRNLFKEIKKEKIDILIYNFCDIKEIKRLNKLKKTKVLLI